MMHQMGLPSDVAASMEDAVCQTNWEEVGGRLMSTQTTYSVMIEQVRATMRKYWVVFVFHVSSCTMVLRPLPFSFVTACPFKMN